MNSWFFFSLISGCGYYIFLKGEGGWFYIAKKADVAHISKGTHTNVL